MTTSEAEMHQRIREVTRTVDSVTTREGAGFLVHRPFPTETLEDVDPFLLLDEMGPMELGPGEAKGAPSHPHRGFETVTYLLSGEMEHRDSRGNAGALRPGDVQWMTAGSGVIHSEMPSERFMREGGRMHGFQLWVNLPRNDKMMAPRYQEISSAAIPTATPSDGGATIRVIAGEAFGVKAAIDTRTPILYMHVTMEAGDRVLLPIPPSFQLFAYVFEGLVAFGTSKVECGRGEMSIFGEGDWLEAANPTSDRVQFLLVGGEPLREPIARYGPFVMNTRGEIMKAIADYQEGVFDEASS